MWNEIINRLLDIVFLALSTAVTIGIPILIAQLAGKIKSQKLQSCLYTLGDQAVLVVNELNQTVVSDLKKAAEDGKLTKEEAVMIKNDAIDIVKENVPKSILNTLEKNKVNIESAIVTAIESAVNRLK